MERYIYKCEGLRPLTSDTVPGIVQAAQIFASRIARHHFGRRGRFVELSRQGREGHYTVEMSDGVRRSITQGMYITKEVLPSYTKQTAMEAALLGAEETGKPFILYCRSRVWNVVAEAEFAFGSKTPGLTVAIKVSPNGRMSNPLGKRRKRQP